jgi:hypothetical protein
VIAPFMPILVVDVGGSVLMIVFSFLCVGLAYRLRRLDAHNVVWTYLFWVCIGLAGFAVSRSAGHILKQALLLSGQKETWAAIRPFSGTVNTFMFSVASVTLSNGCGRSTSRSPPTARRCRRPTRSCCT